MRDAGRGDQRRHVSAKASFAIGSIDRVKFALGLRRPSRCTRRAIVPAQRLGPAGAPGAPRPWPSPRAAQTQHSPHARAPPNPRLLGNHSSSDFPFSCARVPGGPTAPRSRRTSPRPTCGLLARSLNISAYVNLFFSGRQERPAKRPVRFYFSVDPPRLNPCRRFGEISVSRKKQIFSPGRGAQKLSCLAVRAQAGVPGGAGFPRGIEPATCPAFDEAPVVD